MRRLEVRAAVADLDERDRELVALRYGADLTARQIGTLLDLTTNAVEVALHRALRRLRQQLESADRTGSEPKPSVAFESAPADVLEPGPRPSEVDTAASAT